MPRNVPSPKHRCNELAPDVTARKRTRVPRETPSGESSYIPGERPWRGRKGEAMAESALNSGDTAWMLTSAALVLLMLPGLALFYGGMTRAKSVLNMTMMVFGALFLVGVIWILYGYSMTFGTDVAGGLIGNPTEFLRPAAGLMADDPEGPSRPWRSWPSRRCSPPSRWRSSAGAIADRAKFGTWMVFCRHLGDARLLPGRALGLERRRLDLQRGGPLNGVPAIDFAGGTAVHINAGAAGLALAIVLGKRGAGRKTPDEAAQPDARHARCGPAVVRLVRVQRRLGAGRQQHGRGGLHQHLRRHVRRGPGLAAHGEDPRRSRDQPRCGLRRRCRPGRHHAGLLGGQPDRRARARRSSPVWCARWPCG